MRGGLYAVFTVQ